MIGCGVKPYSVRCVVSKDITFGWSRKTIISRIVKVRDHKITF